MAPWAWIIVAIVIVVVVVAIALASARRRRAALRDRFGPEYDRTVERSGSTRAAEQDLRDRERLHDELELRPLSEVTRTRYLDRWNDIQATFVDDPQAAVTEADGLVQRVMQERGYAGDDPDLDRGLAAVSVDHPDTVERYRDAHGVAIRARVNDASTEDLRQAMTNYRALFDELLSSGAERGVR